MSVEREPRRRVAPHDFPVVVHPVAAPIGCLLVGDEELHADVDEEDHVDHAIRPRERRGQHLVEARRLEHAHLKRRDACCVEERKGGDRVPPLHNDRGRIECCLFALLQLHAHLLHIASNPSRHLPQGALWFVGGGHGGARPGAGRE